jgi:DNA polymerase elongation subunit (family B)
MSTTSSTDKHFFLLETFYDKKTNKAGMKFYDEEEEKIITYIDETGHKPYCIADLPDKESFYNLCRILYTESNPDDDGIFTIDSFPCEEIEKYDGISHKTKKMLKIYGDNPSEVNNPYEQSKITIAKLVNTGRKDENFGREYNIQYHQSYRFDTHLVMGMPYRFVWKDIEVLEEQKCNTCGNKTGIFQYFEYIKKDYKNNQGIVLGKIKCRKCKKFLYINKSIKFNDYTHIYNIERRFDYERKIKRIHVPEIILPEIDKHTIDRIEEAFKHESDDELELMKKWIPRLFARFPVDMRMCGYDIETFDPSNKRPSADGIKKAENPISCITLIDNRGNKRILANDVWVEMGEKLPIPKDVKVKIYKKKNERKMIMDIFSIMKKYNILVDFNGRGFDIPYLFYRARTLKISNEIIPFQARYKSRYNTFDITFKWNCIHLDLYQFFSKKSLKAYAFSSAYEANGLGINLNEYNSI